MQYRYPIQSGLYYMCFPQTIDLAPYMSRIYHQLRSKKTRGPDVAASVSRLIFMRCHDNVQSDTSQSSPECRTDTTIRAQTVYTTNVTHVPVPSPGRSSLMYNLGTHICSEKLNEEGLLSQGLFKRGVQSKLIQSIFIHNNFRILTKGFCFKKGNIKCLLIPYCR